MDHDARRSVDYLKRLRLENVTEAAMDQREILTRHFIKQTTAWKRMPNQNRSDRRGVDDDDDDDDDVALVLCYVVVKHIRSFDLGGLTGAVSLGITDPHLH